MRVAWHGVWGSAHGAVRRFAPPTRLVLATLVFAACLLTPAQRPAGALWLAALVPAWLFDCRPPARIWGGALAFGLVLFVPYLLLGPLLVAEGAAVGDAPAWRDALATAAGVAARGLAGLLVCVGAAASFAPGEGSEALARLPVPRLLSAILVQIAHQSATLRVETGRVASAMAVRGATRGWRTGWRVVTSLPGVWLPRVVRRAERVAAAMELRGYDVESFRLHPGRPARGADVAAVLLACALVGVSIGLRHGGPA